ncbi:MAG TPA: outer membrane beta-barrel protein [Gemmatimonadales bacterium]|nr:outer membrane beta-barrel protein [Gemmatimonadales bacterium]
MRAQRRIHPLVVVAALACLSAPSLAVEASSQGAPPAAPPAETVIAAAPKPEPFSFADFTWLNGNSRQTTFPLSTEAFTGEFSFDANYVFDFAHPKDDSLVGSTNSGRTGEFQVENLGLGGDFHWKNVRGRILTQFGLYSTMTPRNDASPGRGQWSLADVYRYLSEAYGGYHFDVLYGINVDIGLFMSYVGLCSYYNYENWVYQMSYVSANTPWFFNGARIQIFPSDRLKVELWLVNGWQAYGKFNTAPGFGWQILWRPTGWISFVTNEYFGTDTLGNPDRWRMHTDTSIQIKYFDQPGSVLDKMAFSFTVDAGCELGGGVSCFGGNASSPSQFFLGFMFYNRFWFVRDVFALTVGVGAINNPGRYLVLLPSINGATAFSGTPYFTANPGDPFKAWDSSITFDFMPTQFTTVRLEYIHRGANVPYFAGPGGITPPGGNQGAPGSVVAGFQPSLATFENRMNLAFLIRI